MATEIRVPALGESVTEAIVGKWLKSAGDSVSADEPLVELETDKVTFEGNAPTSGVLGEIKAAEGTTVAVGAVLGAITNGAAAATAAPKLAQAASEPVAAAANPTPAPKPVPQAPNKSNGEMPPSPAARKKLAEAGIDAASVAGSGKRGQILKEDVPAAKPKAPEPDPSPAPPSASSSPPTRGLAPMPVPVQHLRVPSPPNDAARE